MWSQEREVLTVQISQVLYCLNNKQITESWLYTQYLLTWKTGVSCQFLYPVQNVLLKEFDTLLPM